MSMFKPASKKKQKLRLLIEGASGSGKTYSALLLAKTLGKKVAVIDTENGSASLYDKLTEFDVCELNPPFTPEKYISAIKGAEEAGYKVLIIDSITHEWSGEGGCLDIYSSLGGKFNDWAKVTPRHKKFLECILRSNLHIIATSRTKTDYALEEGINKQGKSTTKPVKVGLKTEQREGLDYEFTVVLRLNEKHLAHETKDRTGLFKDLDFIITEDTGIELLNWLNEGEEEPLPIINEDDAKIYEKIALIQTVEDLNNHYLQNKNIVLSEKTFAEFCKRRKQIITDTLN